MDCAISVIVPIYNAGERLHRCISSILRQSFRDFELLLVNDGSTDDSGSVCERYAALDRRVKVIHQANAGTSAAKNAGIANAAGSYIAFVDADDEVAVPFLSSLYEAAEDLACDVVVSGYVAMPGGRIVTPRFKLRAPMNGADFVLSSEAVHSNNDLCFAWRSLFKREHLAGGRIRFREELSIGEDTIFTLEALLRSGRVCAIPDPNYRYTVDNPGSIMNAAYKPQLASVLIRQYEWRKRLSEQFGLLTCRHYRKDMADYYVRSIYGMLVKNLKNGPSPPLPADLDAIVRSPMMTDSASELGFMYKCGSMKEYLHFLALKGKLTPILFNKEFRDKNPASLSPSSR
ncbi:glycosyltransferase family 2 protein [Paenibacillus arenilitoris]|uniref:Glycosyltransferase n=1 Tax=Paenibacillus arenilitoris TaxID=2772299 RepID=A0A927CKN1_9BACL|nr:glycosyltransferase [Paenibacillus arenilitoris]MBD2869205.1 glycosyltransferase [Paenibacillus arenilitoris]